MYNAEKEGQYKLGCTMSRNTFVRSISLWTMGFFSLQYRRNRHTDLLCCLTPLACYLSLQIIYMLTKNWQDPPIRPVIWSYPGSPVDRIFADSLCIKRCPDDYRLISYLGPFTYRPLLTGYSRWESEPPLLELFPTKDYRLSVSVLLGGYRLKTRALFNGGPWLHWFSNLTKPPHGEWHVSGDNRLKSKGIIRWGLNSTGKVPDGIDSRWMALTDHYQLKARALSDKGRWLCSYCTRGNRLRTNGTIIQWSTEIIDTIRRGLILLVQYWTRSAWKMWDYPMLVNWGQMHLLDAHHWIR